MPAFAPIYFHKVSKSVNLGQMLNTSHLSYCKERVRQFDQDRYLTALFAPEEIRQGLYVLYAFNLEIARIPEISTESLVGQIRLEWWREAIATAYEKGTPPEHVVARPLAETIRAHGLTQAHFDRLLEARLFDQERRPPVSLDELETYAEATSSSLVQLALEMLGVRDNAAAATAARAIGVAWALIGLLRAVPFHGSADRVYLPRDLMREGGVTVRQIRSRKTTAGLEAIAKTLADEARAGLRLARDLAPSVPEAALPALLLGTLADGHLRALEKAGYDLFDARVQRPPAFREFRLWLRARRGNY